MKRKLTVAFLAMIMALSLAFGIISASAEGASAWTAEGNTVTVTNCSGQIGFFGQARQWCVLQPNGKDKISAAN